MDVIAPGRQDTFLWNDNPVFRSADIICDTAHPCTPIPSLPKHIPSSCGKIPVYEPFQGHLESIGVRLGGALAENSGAGGQLLAGLDLNVTERNGFRIAVLRAGYYGFDYSLMIFGYERRF